MIGHNQSATVASLVDSSRSLPRFAQL